MTDEANTEAPAETAFTFRCEECGRSFTSSAGLTIHKGRVHSPNVPVAGNLDHDDAKLLKLVFPDGSVPISKLADLATWLELTKRLRDGK